MRIQNPVMQVESENFMEGENNWENVSPATISQSKFKMHVHSTLRIRLYLQAMNPLFT